MSLNNIKILIVDDEEKYLITLQKKIKQDFPECGHPFTASNFKSAIEILKNNNIDILLTDYILGDEYKSGFDLCVFVHKNYPNIRKIIITNKTERLYTAETELKRIDAVVTKLNDVDGRLTECINDVIARKEMLKRLK